MKCNNSFDIWNYYYCYSLTVLNINVYFKLLCVCDVSFLMFSKDKSVC